MNTEFDFFNWYNFKATKEERYLADRVREFEELFHDMMFEPDTSSGKFIRVKTKSLEDDEWSEMDMDIPENLTYEPYQFCRLIVTQPEDGSYGYFDRQNQILCIAPKYLKDDSAILHEMIHMHEFVVNEYPIFYHEALLWSLYSDLKNKIPELDTIINEHAHILNENILYESGGLHDILFLLKSFDLDIKKGYSLGTVFGYGRGDDFKDYSYIT